MINFEYSRANNVADAVRQIAADPKARLIAGGTNLIDLMKEEVERPSRLIDITHLPLKAVEELLRAGHHLVLDLPIERRKRFARRMTEDYLRTEREED